MTQRSKLQQSKKQSVSVLTLYQLGFSVFGTLVPALTARYAYRLWLQPLRFKTPVSERPARDSATIRKLDLGKHTITSYQWGEQGRPVLLIHGWSGRGTQLGAFVEPLLDTGFRVFSFDLPAHGQSSGRQTTMLEVVEVIEKIVEQYGPFDYAITHSFGGPCLALAIKQGITVKRVAVISPPANTRLLFKNFARILHLRPKTVSCMEQRMEKEYGKDIWDRISMINNVASISVPALIIHDKDDQDVAYEQGKMVAEKWPGARFVTTSGLGHRRILRDKSIIETTVQFLSDTE